MLYEPPKTKRYIAIGAAALVVLALVFWGAQKMKLKPVETTPASVQKADAEKQQDIIKALNEANPPTQNDSNAQQEKIQIKEEILNAVEKSNPSAESIPQEVRDQKSQEIMNAMGAANPSKK
jgi:hypothetical protein